MNDFRHDCTWLHRGQQRGQPGAIVPKVVHDEEMERQTEENGRNYLHSVLADELLEERRRKQHWSCAMCLWCTVMLLLFIIIFAGWEAIHYDNNYYKDEMV